MAPGFQEKWGDTPGTCDKWLYPHDKLEGRPFPLCCYSQTGPCSWEVHGRGVRLRPLPAVEKSMVPGTAYLSFRCWVVCLDGAVCLHRGQVRIYPGHRTHRAHSRTYK